MSEQQKDKAGNLVGMEFDEAIARLLQTNPEEFTEALTKEVLRSHERAKTQIKKVREEIADGARPKKGRFRL